MIKIKGHERTGLMLPWFYYLLIIKNKETEETEIMFKYDYDGCLKELKKYENKNIEYQTYFLELDETGEIKSYE